MIKKRTLNIAQQFSTLKRDYNFGKIKLINFNQLEWIGILRSSPLGSCYLIKVVYKKKESPKVYILEPKELKMPTGKSKLEHVYDHKKQRLCLYYPKAKEWDETKTIASTILPWTIEWLYHYEIWLITGEWKGGGIHTASIKK